MLIDVHSQHQNLLLNKENFQLNVIDILAGDKDELQQYKRLYTAYKQSEKALQQARQAAEQARTEEDYITFQLEQLENAALKTGEQEDLEQEAISDCMKQSGIMMHHQEYHSSIMRRSGSGKSCAGILITVVEWFGFQHMQSIRCSVIRRSKVSIRSITGKYLQTGK